VNWASRSARAWSTSARAYQTSRWVIPANSRIASRYRATAAMTMSRRCLVVNPLSRPALQAGRQPLDIPLPRAGQGLVEVVDVEHQAALGRAEDAEVGQVSIAAGLHRQPGYRRPGQVAGHRQGRAPVIGERGHQHPAPPDPPNLTPPR